MRTLHVWVDAFCIAVLAAIVAGLISSNFACTTTPTRPASNPEPMPTATITPAPPGPPVTATIASGFTVESIDNLKSITDFIDSLGFRPTIRTVFQAGERASSYTKGVAEIRKRATVVGELLDSEGMESCSQSCIEKRAKEYAAAFAGKIDIIEACNEINGTGWLGSNTVEKCSAAIRIVKAAGIPTMLTLYDEEGDTWKAWIKKLPADVLPLVDYVSLSSYPDDNAGHAASLTEFTNIVAARFPNLKGIGLGECGPGYQVFKKRTTAEKVASAKACWAKTVSHPLWNRWGGFWYGDDALARYPKEFAAALKGAA